MRLPQISPDALTPDQQSIFDESVAGKRGTVAAPLRAWIHSPDMARHASRLGAFLRYDTTLGQQNSELAILVIARHWSARYEWHVHKRMALEAGLAPAIIDAINLRQVLKLDDPKAQLVYDFSTTIQETRDVPKPLYDRAIAILGEKGTVELVGLLGYYTLISMTLNAFDVPLPDGEISDLAP